jgi:DNA polymerase-3 subunit epsilon
MRIREAREERGLTLSEVADGAGISKGYLSTIEEGKANPTISTLTDIAYAIGIQMADIFKEETMDHVAKKVCFIDLETTGLDPSKHEIIELAALVVDPTTWQIIRELELKVKPEHIETAEQGALAINGYSPDNWEGAVSLEWAMSELEPLLCDAIPAGHNPRFDLGFMEAAWKKVGHRPQCMDYHVLDTVSLCMPLYLTGELTSLKLEAVCSHLGVPMPTHRAMADCRASLEIARTIIGGGGGSRPRPESSPSVDPGEPDTLDGGIPSEGGETMSVLVRYEVNGDINSELLKGVTDCDLGVSWLRLRGAGKEVAYPAKRIVRVSAERCEGES